MKKESVRTHTKTKFQHREISRERGEGVLGSRRLLCGIVYIL